MAMMRRGLGWLLGAVGCAALVMAYGSESDDTGVGTGTKGG
jgi:hypothetical protein